MCLLCLCGECIFFRELKPTSYRWVTRHLISGDRFYFCQMNFLRFITVTCLMILIACQDNRPLTIKDLDENMIDLKIYQQNLGDELKAGRLQDAIWLLDGMDSVLKEVSRKFKEHRKLSEPFSYFYKNQMKKPVRLMWSGIKNNDTAVAMKGYRLLIKNCNGCHIDHDISKSVIY